MSRNLVDLENDIKNNNLNGIYIFYGEEKYLQEEYLRRIKKSFGDLNLGINYILLDENSITSMISDIETPAFGYDKKLIIIRNSNIFKKDYKLPIKEKFKEYINENVEIINKSCVIVFLEETIHKMDLYKTIEKYSTIIETKYMKPNELKERLKKICSMYNVKASDSTIDYLIEISGTNMQDLLNEIRKLIEYAGENGQIKKEDIDLLSIKDVQAIIFDLTDCLGEKNTQKALNVLDNLIYNKEPIQKIIVTLYNHFKKLYLTKLAIIENRDLAEVLNLKSNQIFLISKYKKQAKSFSEDDIKEILIELIDLDYKYKNGQIDLDIGLKSIICKNCWFYIEKKIVNIYNLLRNLQKRRLLWKEEREYR